MPPQDATSTAFHAKTEAWLQAIWAHQLFESHSLSTHSGNSIQILFPGWLNTSAGPDFLDARVRIGQTEYQGAIEIHLNARDWHAHQHHLDNSYNQVILHVVLYASKRIVLNQLQQPIPELILHPYLSPEQVENLDQPQLLLDTYDQLPGKCGLKQLKQPLKTLQHMIDKAAEQRIQERASQISAKLQHTKTEEEQLLYKLIFKSLGFHKYHQLFEQLAQLYPYQTLHDCFRQPYRQARIQVLSRWFGSCGLFNAQSQLPSIREPTLRKEYYQWYMEWKTLDSPQVLKNFIRYPTRPFHTLERRLVGMFHHLYHTHRQGLLKSWISLLLTLRPYQNQAALKSTLNQQTQNSFTTPSWEPWLQHFKVKSKEITPSQLIGKDRQMIIWANAILPFFLAYMREHPQHDLEALLYRIFIIIPAEPENHKTRFMKKRLHWQRLKKEVKSSLRTQQGLIQIYHDFCHNFYQGCLQCQLPMMMESYEQQEKLRKEEIMLKENL